MDKDPGDGGDGRNTPPDDKKEILYRAMCSAQPKFSDFEGCTGYPRRMLQADQEWLDQKYEEILYSDKVNADDEFAHYMEPIITYALNSETLLPSRDSFSFLASDYDDKRNGTDIVFGIKDNKSAENIVFSIDVATGTLLENIQKKYKNSHEKHDGKSYVKYCMYKDQRWREPDAPHFILGMSPASQDKAMDKIIITNGELRGREEDLDSDFVLLSEIREQINMHLAILRNKPKTEQTEKMAARLNSILPAIYTGLDRVLGIKKPDYSTEEEHVKMFLKEYTRKKEQLSRFDDVYKNIISVAKQRATGAKSLKSALKRRNYE